MAGKKKWFKENSKRILGIISAFSFLLAAVFCPLTVYKADDSRIVELGIEEQFVANYGLQNVYGKWDVNDFYYMRPAVSNEYKYWCVLKGINGAPYRYICFYANMPFELTSGSSYRLWLMGNCDDSKYSFSRECGMSCSYDGINWTNYTWDSYFTGIAKYNSGKGYIYYYKFCESNYYIFDGSNGNNWNNDSFVYAQSPYVRPDNVMDFCGVLNALGLPMPSTVNAGSSYNVLYKSGDVYILDSFTSNDVRVDIAHASGSVPWSESAMDGYMPLYSCDDGYYRDCLYYYNGAWNEYYSGISANDSNINLIIENDLISSLDDFVYTSDFIVYSDFDIYRSAEVLSGIDLADYGVPYVMYDVETGSYIEGSTPPEPEPDSGTEEPDSGTEDSGSSDDEYNGQLDSEYKDAEDKSSELGDLIGDMDIEKPDLEDINTNLDDYVSSDDVAQVSTLLSIFTENNIIKTFLLVSFTMALVGYVFFGKR